MYTTFYHDFFNILNNTGWYRNSLTPSTVYVVSEERIKELEQKKKEQTLKSIDTQIEELQAHRKTIKESLPALEHDKE
jgi:uncharacterized protein related to proFAR isomerase